MSYVLDALRRADAERERGPVPDLHAQPVLRGSAPAPSSLPPLLKGVAIGVAVVLIAALGVLIGKRLQAPGDKPAPAVAAAPQPQTAPLSSDVPPVSIAPTPAPPQAAPLPVELPRRAPPPARVPRRDPAPPSPAPAVATAPAPAPAPAPLVSSSDAPGGGMRVATYAELPDNVRRELQPLVVNSALYAERPSERMLFINGQVLREGEQLIPGLRLEQIALKSALFSYKGRRFTLAY